MATATLYPTADVWVDSDGNRTTSGTSLTVYNQKAVMNGKVVDHYANARAYLRFDLSAISGTINSASISVYKSNSVAVSGSVYLRQVTAEVDPVNGSVATVYNNAAGTSIGSRAVNSVGTITADVQSYVNTHKGGFCDFGINTDSAAESDNYITSTEAGSNRPVLTIDYTPDASIPDAPTNPTSSLSTNDITVGWTKSTGATGYKVYRDTTTNPTTLVATLGDVDSWADNDKTAGYTYFYRIKATNTAGDSDYSANTSVTYNNSTPTIGTATAGQYGQITITATTTAGENNTTVKLFRASSEGGTYSDVSANCVISNPSGQNWTIVDTRPAYGTPSIALDATAYYKVKAVGSGDAISGLSTGVNAVTALNKTTIVSDKLTNMRNGFTTKGDGYASQLVTAAYAYYVSGSNDDLTLVENQFEAMKTARGADYLTYYETSYISMEHQTRAGLYTYIAQMLVRQHNTTYADEILAELDTWIDVSVDSPKKTGYQMYGWPSAQPALQRNTAYAYGDTVKLTVDGVVTQYCCTTAGTTAGSLPTYTKGNGDAITDGTAVFTCDNVSLSIYYRGYKSPEGRAAVARNTAYSVGDYVKATEGGLVRQYRCTTGGTTHLTTKPTYPTTQDATVTDGTAVFKCDYVLEPHLPDSPTTHFVIANQESSMVTIFLLLYYDANSSLYGDSRLYNTAHELAKTVIRQTTNAGGMAYADPNVRADLSDNGTNVGYMRFTVYTMGVLLKKLGANAPDRYEEYMAKALDFLGTYSTEPTLFNGNEADWEVDGTEMLWQKAAFEIMDEADPAGDLAYTTAFNYYANDAYGSYEQDGIKSGDEIYDDYTYDWAYDWFTYYGFVTAFFTGPTSLVATYNEGTGDIDLEFVDRSDDETGFEIERKVGAGAWTALTTNSANDTTYTDTDVTSGLYQYRVRANYTLNDSEWAYSNVVNRANAINVIGVVATGTGIAPVPTVTAVRVVNVTGVAPTGIGTAPAPTVVAQKQVYITGVVATGTGEAPVPTVTAVRDKNITAVSANGIAEALPGTVTVSESIVGVPAEAIAEVPTPTITTERSKNILAVVASAIGEAIVATIVAQKNTNILAIAAESTGETSSIAINPILVDGDVAINIGGKNYTT